MKKRYDHPSSCRPFQYEDIINSEFMAKFRGWRRRIGMICIVIQLTSNYILAIPHLSKQTEEWHTKLIVKHLTCRRIKAPILLNNAAGRLSNSRSNTAMYSTFQHFEKQLQCLMWFGAFRISHLDIRNKLASESSR